MEAKYRNWLGKREKDKDGNRMIAAVHGLGDWLDGGGSAKSVVELILNMSRSGFSAENRVQAALAIAVLHERGDEFRFEWNRHYKGEDWALDMEISEKRLHNPA